VRVDAGARVGHVTLDGTGVTCILLPPGTVGAGEVRGGAPASRELALLDPLRTVAHVDAVVFTGGSAFGLAAADGVMRHLAARGRGYPTAGGPVPIVPAMAVFDLVGGALPPTAAHGAVAAATAEAAFDLPSGGRVGAGAGATVGKWRGRDSAAPGGVGVVTAHAAADAVHLLCVAVVNAVGDVVADDGRVLAGSRAPADAPAFPTTEPFREGENTTLVALVTDAALDKPACALLAQHAHDGVARALRPAHTRYDGDATVALATGIRDGNHGEVSLDRVLHWGALVAAAAIRAAVRAPGTASLDLG
jgi:L-aminopeptidase/D-esterase-like protein